MVTAREGHSYEECAIRRSKKILVAGIQNLGRGSFFEI